MGHTALAQILGYNWLLPEKCPNMADLESNTF